MIAKMFILLVVIHFSYSQTKPIKLKGKSKGRPVIGSGREIIGVEFNRVPRFMLLKLLSQVEEHIKTRIRGGGRPVFTAHFANNVYTRPYVYPETKNKG